MRRALQGLTADVHALADALERVNGATLTITATPVHPSDDALYDALMRSHLTKFEAEMAKRLEARTSR